jgi:ABC-type branched-subunit amino acid transport system permease subunit
LQALRDNEQRVMCLGYSTFALKLEAFTIAAVLVGYAGGLLALLLTWVSSLLINRYIVETAFFDERTAALGLLFGAMIGLVGSSVSVGRHLRSV